VGAKQVSHHNPAVVLGETPEKKRKEAERKKLWGRAGGRLGGGFERGGRDKREIQGGK
jgi:hypothetical protein